MFLSHSGNHSNYIQKLFGLNRVYHAESCPIYWNISQRLIILNYLYEFCVLLGCELWELIRKLVNVNEAIPSWLQEEEKIKKICTLILFLTTIHCCLLVEIIVFLFKLNLFFISYSKRSYNFIPSRLLVSSFVILTVLGTKNTEKNTPCDHPDFKITPLMRKFSFSRPKFYALFHCLWALITRPSRFTVTRPVNSHPFHTWTIFWGSCEGRRKDLNLRPPHLTSLAIFLRICLLGV